MHASFRALICFNIGSFPDPELQKVTQEVLELVKGIVGREAVSRVYASLQSDVTDTKEQRKKKRALEVCELQGLLVRSLVASALHWMIP